MMNSAMQARARARRINAAIVDANISTFVALEAAQAPEPECETCILPEELAPEVGEFVPVQAEVEPPLAIEEPIEPVEEEAAEEPAPYTRPRRPRNAYREDKKED